MIVPDRATSKGPTSGVGAVRTDGESPDTGPVTTLRGARVEVDGRRAARVAGTVVPLTLLVLSIVFFFVGANKNAQISALRNHGVPVVVTVSKCIGLMGGSGSNPAGYACTGTYVLDGHRYNEAIPGNTLYGPGAKLRGVADANDPQLMSTATDVASQQTSWRVFILPTVLFVAFILLAGGLLLRKRSVGSVLVGGGGTPR
jgi:hypothetical protein